jgi:hypothetical protein
MSSPVSHVIRVAVVLAMGAIGASASAEIHRCKDDRGQTVLSDRPCGAVYVGDPLRSNALGTGADKVAAGEMRTGQSKDLSAQYSFIADRTSHSARRSSDR